MLAVILLVALPVSWVGVLVIAALLALYELWLQRFRAVESPPAPPQEAAIRGSSSPDATSS